MGKEDPNEIGTKLLPKLYLYRIFIYILQKKAHLALNVLETYKSIDGPHESFNDGFEQLLLGQLEEKDEVAIEYFLKSVEIFQKTKAWWFLGESYELLASRADGDVAKDYIQKAIDVATESGNRVLKGLYSCALGFFYQNDGNYNEARIFNTNALDIAKEENFEWGIATASGCLGRICIEEGRISEAIERLELSNKMFLKTIGYRPGHFSSLIMAYRHAGRYEDAIEFAQLLIAEMNIIDTHYGEFFLQLILAALDVDQLDTANKYLNQFKNVSKENDNNTLIIQLKLAKALILKKAKNLASTLRAQEMLEEILKNPAIQYQERILAIRHLCEILLLEYEMFEQENTLREVESLVHQLTSIANKQHLIRLRFDAGILQSKLQLLFGNIEEGKALLVDLLKLAKDKQLSHYKERLGTELQNLEENFQKWIKLVEGNTSIRDLIEKSKIKDYIIQAKLVSKDID